MRKILIYIYITAKIGIWSNSKFDRTKLETKSKLSKLETIRVEQIKRFFF